MKIDNQGSIKISPGDVLETLDFFSKKIAERGGVVGWFRRLLKGDEGPRLKDVIALPVAVSASDGKIYVRVYLLGAKRKFGKGMLQVIPRIEAILFPDIGHTQVRATEVDGIEDRFPTIAEVDPFYRVVLKLPQPEGEEVCKRVNEKFMPMGVLVSGHIELEKKYRKYEVPVVGLNLYLGGGALGEHQGPLVRPNA